MLASPKVKSNALLEQGDISSLLTHVAYVALCWLCWRCWQRETSSWNSFKLQMTVLIDDATCYCYVDICWLVLTYVDSSSWVDMLLSFNGNFWGNWTLPVLLYVAACRCYVDTCWLTLTNVDKKLCYLCCHICIENFEAIERWVYNGNPERLI